MKCDKKIKMSYTIITLFPLPRAGNTQEKNNVVMWCEDCVSWFFSGMKRVQKKNINEKKCHHILSFCSIILSSFVLKMSSRKYINEQEGLNYLFFDTKLVR